MFLTDGLGFPSTRLNLRFFDRYVDSTTGDSYYACRFLGCTYHSKPDANIPGDQRRVARSTNELEFDNVRCVVDHI